MIIVNEGSCRSRGSIAGASGGGNVAIVVFGLTVVVPVVFVVL